MYSFDGAVTSQVIEGGWSSLQSEEFGLRAGLAVAFSPVSMFGVQAAHNASVNGATRGVSAFIENGYGFLGTSSTSLASSITIELKGRVDRIGQPPERD